MQRDNNTTAFSNNNDDTSAALQPQAVLDAADSIMARELNELSLQEREDASYEIHGISNIGDENPQLIAEGLELLDQELKKLVTSSSAGNRGGSGASGRRDNSNSEDLSSAYREAMSQDRSYVERETFRVMFLRAEQHQKHGTSTKNSASSAISEAAAKRVLKFFDIKRRLFGVEKLTKDITFEDLNVAAQNLLNVGYMTLLPQKDPAGRTILLRHAAFTTAFSNGTSAISASQVFFYTLMCAITNDVEAQRKGLIFITYAIDAPILDAKGAFEERQALSMNACIMSSVPFRMICMHCCYNRMISRPLLTFALMLMERHQRVRIRAHFGSHQEVQYVLMTFGIHTSLLPVSSNGDINLKYHLHWLENRRNIELKRTAIATSSSSDNSNECLNSLEKMNIRKQPVSSASSPNQEKIVPCPDDVLFGRGLPIRQLPGNVRFHGIIEDHIEQYEKTDSRFEKTVIAEMIVRTIKEKYGGRFLKQVRGGWEEVTFEQARSKVSHTFRNRRLPSYGRSFIGGGNLDKRQRDSSSVEEPMMVTRTSNMNLSEGSVDGDRSTSRTSWFPSFCLASDTSHAAVEGAWMDSTKRPRMF